MKFQAVIFDLDGTLVNSIYGLMYSMNNILRRHGLEEQGVDKYRIYVGHGLRDLVRKSAKLDNPDDPRVELFYGEMVEDYLKNWDYQLYAYEGIIPLLDALVKKNIKLGVNTNKKEEIARLILDKYFPGYFAYMIGGRSSLPHKPDPTAALIIAGELGVEPSQCIYMGDSDVDIHTARNAKMYAVGAAWGFRGRDELVAAGAEAVINEPMELLKILV
jgi:phosphoglycolate phosphatase